ncbi:MerR family transcriptional regulator [Solirubrobacter phytolaccae]|uniref:MerR family transcriptional regulator n=1 Tax=Solirubrobacter phytolaccae TaxID=1404360 RepID=A0A9X3NGB0_9ACTN|nr:DICT sensory domain-containing protein [Solirubrobacter phytolaccae]MDA0184552.1 MerR family transcriptional regulator [Solirubrobacter phytolaccae]
MKKLAIKDVAEQTGVAAGTIRMWEQRYGFPEPARTASGYRMYSEEDVATIRRVVAFRDRGLSVPAALERARAQEGTTTDRASIFAALVAADAPVRPQRLSKPTLVALSRAIEEEAMARAAGPVVIGAFQDERNYRAVEHRYRRMARVADAVGVFATFDALRVGEEDEPAEIPVGTADALGHEWAVVVDAPGFAAALVGWETPTEDEGQKIFEAVWTMDPTVVRRAAQVGATLAARQAPEWSEHVIGLLADRPLAVEVPTPGLTAVTNRMLGFLDAAR